MSDFGKVFIAFFVATLLAHYLVTDRIIDSCADFGKFKSRGVIYECKALEKNEK